MGWPLRKTSDKWGMLPLSTGSLKYIERTQCKMALNGPCVCVCGGVLQREHLQPRGQKAGSGQVTGDRVKGTKEEQDPATEILDCFQEGGTVY